MGFTLPPTMDIAMAATGLLGTPMLANYVFNNFVASTSYGTSKWAYLGVEALSAAALAFAAKKALGPSAGQMVAIGAGARVVLDAVSLLAPTLLPSTAMPANLSGMGIGQPFLGNGMGYYNRRPWNRGGLGYYNRAPGAKQGGMIQQIPARLDPSFRF